MKLSEASDLGQIVKSLSSIPPRTWSRGEIFYPYTASNSFIVSYQNGRFAYLESTLNKDFTVLQQKLCISTKTFC